MHSRPLGELTWSKLKSSIEALPNPKNWLNLSDVQKIHSPHTQKIASLSALINKISGSDDVAEHIEVTLESLKRIHGGKSTDGKFLSGAHLQCIFEHVIPLPKFEKPLGKYQSSYEAVKKLVKTIAGEDDQVRVKSFLESQFPSLRAEEISWKSIFKKVEHLAANTSSRAYAFQMKKLLDKFPNDEAVEFFREMYPHDDIINHEILLDLKKLCNHIGELRRNKRSNEHLLNFRRGIISCLVNTFSKNQLREAGWDITKKLYKSCKRKREDEEEFINLDPNSKSGRKAIGNELKEKIELLWHNYSCAGAKTLVTNPNNRSERRPGRRLSKPARHIILESEIHKKQLASYGTI